MSKKLTAITVLSWLLALVIWQLVFNSHHIVAEILWEIHTIFSSVLLFYILLNLIFADEILDFIKICFRIVFKVWLIIFIAFAMQNSFNQKAFVLTTTFIFGYLEGLIDVNAWLRNKSLMIFPFATKYNQTKFDKIQLSIIAITIVHSVCAFIALVFFSIK